MSTAGEILRDPDDLRNDLEPHEPVEAEVRGKLALTPAEPVTWKAVYLYHN